MKLCFEAVCAQSSTSPPLASRYSFGSGIDAHAWITFQKLTRSFGGLGGV
ncbi:hypothetical protein ACWC3Y_12035 [Streptomyces sp. NPDC001296]